MKTDPIIVIGRGNSGTRAIAETLKRSGVYMGRSIRDGSYDTMPPLGMYEAARIVGRHVKAIAPNQWDFDTLLYQLPPDDFIQAVSTYLVQAGLGPDNEYLHKGPWPWGWKLPETLLAFPWIARLFPNARYIHWTRNPFDTLRGEHMTDDLTLWNVRLFANNWSERKALSWIYQQEIVKAHMKTAWAPNRFISVRFEDFCADQQGTLDRLGEFLGFPLARIVVKPASDKPRFEFPASIARRYGY